MIFSDLRIKTVNNFLHFTPQYSRFKSENRKYHIIGIQLYGTADHIFADREFTLHENCIYFFNQNEDYIVDVKEKGACISIHFTTFVPINIKSFCIRINDNISIIQTLNRIGHLFMNAGKCNVKVLSELYKLFSKYEDIYLKEYSPSNLKIIKAKEFINLHFKETDCITSAAKEYGVTVRRFNDIFKQNFNTTPNQYIINHKINLAKKLLESKEFSISEISNLCGFEDIYYFSKTFKKVTGQTATEFKKKL
ncbi:MAG: helix-turn-helix transcriptional regulator [Ruminococcaceae bacterium]|nr:helix-turn-helix transcriptional regulator [Oscillospiraceae bacterium]